MKSKILILGIIIFISIAGGCGGSNSVSQRVDKETGIVIRHDSPRATVLSFFELISRGRAEEAYTLLTASSMLELSEEEFKDIIRTTRTESARLINVMPGSENDSLAVVAHIRLIPAGNKEEIALFGIEIVRKHKNLWYISRNISEFGDKDKVQILENLITFEDELLNTPDLFATLTEQQQEQALKQLNTLYRAHQEALEKF
ncbi:MAG: hypothetical protein KGZ63_06810 [Clostridiales bacterium]|nr:hypothetical protein [Clostridiales bacterium]